MSECLQQRGLEVHRRLCSEQSSQKVPELNGHPKGRRNTSEQLDIKEKQRRLNAASTKFLVTDF